LAPLFLPRTRSLPGRKNLHYLRKTWIKMLANFHLRAPAMSKGMDKKKETKKKTAKTLEEKRAAKKEKKENKKFMSH
jgi:hypothetical protein